MLWGVEIRHSPVSAFTRISQRLYIAPVVWLSAILHTLSTRISPLRLRFPNRTRRQRLQSSLRSAPSRIPAGTIHRSDDHGHILEAVGAYEVFNPEEDAARSMVQRLTISNIRNCFELTFGFSLVEVEAPAGIIGRSLRDLDLRQRFRVNLVALKRMATDAEGRRTVKEFKAVPMPGDVIQAGDVLALAGSVLDLARFVGDNS
jgi:hypothetical protein